MEYLTYFNHPGDLRILDLQFLSSGDPVFDLGIIIFFNSNEDYGAEPDRLYQLLELYHSTFNNTLEQLGCGSSKGTFNSLKERYKYYIEHDQEIYYVLFRFFSVGVKGAILFGLLNYDIMIIYEKLIERFSNLMRLKERRLCK